MGFFFLYPYILYVTQIQFYDSSLTNPKKRSDLPFSASLTLIVQKNKSSHA